MNNDFVVGVDLGSSKVAVVAARAVPNSRNKTIEILGFSEIPLSDGAIVNGSVENVKQVGDAIRAAIDKTAELADLDIGVVNVSFGGMQVRVSEQSDGVIRPTSSSGEEVTQKDVDQLVSDVFRAKRDTSSDVMHVFPKDFIVDGTAGVREPVGRPGIKLGGDFVVVLANTQSIQRTKKGITTADPALQVDKMILSPVATGLAVLTDDERKAGIALVDIGDHTTDLIIFQNNVIRHIATFPLGGRHITSDIRLGCQIQHENAEQLKKKYGSALSENVPLNIEVLVNFLAGRPPKAILKKNIALIIEERLKEIASLIYSEILRVGYAEDLIGGAVLTGGTSELPEIETLFGRIFNDMPVRVGLPEDLAHTPKADAVSKASFATALGLVWAGVKPIDNRVTSVCRPLEKPVVTPAPVAKEEEPVSSKRSPWSRFWNSGKEDDAQNVGEY